MNTARRRRGGKRKFIAKRIYKKPKCHKMYENIGR
jgi:hypothetical protein